jgi:hypothetical protein
VAGNGYLDVAVLDQRNPTEYYPGIWTGGPADVTGAQVPRERNWICQSGARSGEVCNLQITARADGYVAKAPNRKGGTYTNFYSGGWEAKKRTSPGDTSPQPEEGRQVELVGENGVAIAYDKTADAVDGVVKGYDNADWEMRQTPDGNWEFANMQDPGLTMGYPDGSGFWLSPAGGGEYFQLRHGDQ